MKDLRILVTRSSSQASHLTEKLQHQEAKVIEIPLIAIEPPDSYDELDRALSQLASYQWIIFASANAFKFFWERAQELNIDLSLLHNLKLAAVGQSTAQILGEKGFTVSFCPSNFVAEDLVAQFPNYPNLAGQKILWPRTNLGRTYIADKLREAHASVDEVQTYKTTDPANKDELAKQLFNLLSNKQIDIITLTSAQTVSNLASFVNSEIQQQSSSQSLNQLLEDVAIASIGPETSTAAKKHLGKVTLEANPYTIEGMLIALKKYAQDKKKDCKNN